MKRLAIALLGLGLHVVFCGVAYAASGAALGTSAAVDREGRLWLAYSEPAPDGKAHVMLMRSDDRGATWEAPLQITADAEPVSADGENRPKLAFGPKSEIYVSWTSPTSAQYTGDVRFAHSLDGGRHWSTPQVVHRDRQRIAHRFESLLVDGKGRIWVAWIDKRDLQVAQAAQRDYAGAAIYYAYSQDHGTTWSGDFKLADHSCECCRIALTTDQEGRAVALWRHVFPPNERDHALAVLDPQRASTAITRVTFDRWRIDACPHHGPSLAISADGVRHAVWFNQQESQGRVFYGRLGATAPLGVKALPAGASHADLAVSDDTVAIAWKRFDGSVTRVESWLSSDGGQHFAPGPSLVSSGASDQPRLVNADRDILLVWRRAEGIAVKALAGTAGVKLTSASSSNRARQGTETARVLKPFTRDTLAQIERQYRGTPFWLVLWDLECTYCVKSLRNLAGAQHSHPQLKVVTITTDAMTVAPAISDRLAQLGVKSDAYAFSGAPGEALRYAIDPGWLGEKPRAYRYAADGTRETVSGVISTQTFAEVGLATQQP
jgi:BNR repeat-like domain